jgi:hypothetical protein
LVLRIDAHRGHAEVQIGAQQLVHVSFMAVDASNAAVVLYADGKLAAVSIGEGNHGSGQCLWLDAHTLAVEHLKFGASLQVLDQYFVLIHSDSCFSVITSRKVSDFAETTATKTDKFCQRTEEKWTWFIAQS